MPDCYPGLLQNEIYERTMLVCLFQITITLKSVAVNGHIHRLNISFLLMAIHDMQFIWSVLNFSALVSGLFVAPCLTRWRRTNTRSSLMMRASGWRHTRRKRSSLTSSSEIWRIFQCMRVVQHGNLSELSSRPLFLFFLLVWNHKQHNALKHFCIKVGNTLHIAMEWVPKEPCTTLKRC